MKEKIYFLTFIFILNFIPRNSFSQNYRTIFGSTSTTWDVIHHGYCDLVISYNIFVTNDTIVNANNYRVISGLGGFLREDAVDGKVWFYDTLFKKEYLVMDLGLAPGDTFNIYDYNNDAFPIIVDSVYFVGNLKHVQLEAWTSICGLDEKITFVEGRGPNVSFSYQTQLNGNSVNSYMLCHHKNGVKVGGNKLFTDTCYVFGVGIDENKLSSNVIKIFPNPAGDIVNVSIEDRENENIILNIYNIMGELVRTEILTEQKKQIGIEDLNNGIYFISVKLKNIISNQKMIIQR